MCGVAAAVAASFVLGTVSLSSTALASTEAGTPLLNRRQSAAQQRTVEDSQPSVRVEVWIDLEMSPLSAFPTLSDAQRVAYRREIEAQQSLLIERLRQFGAEERARVQLVRNAVVVEVPESAIESIRQMAGVARVQRVTHRNRIHTPSPAAGR